MINDIQEQGEDMQYKTKRKNSTKKESKSNFSINLKKECYNLKKLLFLIVIYLIAGIIYDYSILIERKCSTSKIENFELKREMNFSENYNFSPSKSRNLDNKEEIKKINKENKEDAVSKRKEFIYNNEINTTNFTETNTKIFIESNKTQLSNNIFSKSGNYFLNKLYNNIIIPLEKIFEVINNTVSSLMKLIKYKDLSYIFDSTLFLDIIKNLDFIEIKESNNLNKNLIEILNNIEEREGEIKQNISKLNQKKIYEFLKDSYIITNSLFDYISKFINLLNSLKPKIEITNISSSCFVNQNHISYIKRDEKRIYRKEIESINFFFNLINSINEENIKKHLNNIYYIKRYINELIEKIQGNKKDEFELKSSEYFISDYENNANMESYSSIINQALKISNSPCSEKIIDASFDEIMNHFCNFTNIHMDQQKEDIFSLNENLLREGIFIKPNLLNNNINLGINIYKKTKKENKNLDEFLDEFQKKFEEFYSSTNENVLLSYECKINQLKKSFLDIEKDSSVQNYTENYLSEINYLLSCKYGAKIIKDLYDYYKKNIQERIEPFLNDISSKKFESFDMLFNSTQK